MSLLSFQVTVWLETFLTANHLLWCILNNGACYSHETLTEWPVFFTSILLARLCADVQNFPSGFFFKLDQNHIVTQETETFMETQVISLKKYFVATETEPDNSNKHLLKPMAVMLLLFYFSLFQANVFILKTLTLCLIYCHQY